MKKLLASIITAAFLLAGCAATGVAEDTTIVSETTTTEATTTVEQTIEDPSEETTEETTEATTETTKESTTEETTEATTEETKIDKDGTYTSRDDVALYIYTYGELPSNFMTKKDAKKLGWEGGSLEDYAPGMCIGGDYFGNYFSRPRTAANTTSATLTLWVPRAEARRG